MKPEEKKQKRYLRHQRVRARIFGTKERPRLSVFRSNKYVHLQLIDDDAGKTLISAQAKQADEAGKSLGEQAVKAGIKQAVFDRGGYAYHGRVKAAAEAVRQAGLKI